MPRKEVSSLIKIHEHKGDNGTFAWRGIREKMRHPAYVVDSDGLRPARGIAASTVISTFLWLVVVVLSFFLGYAFGAGWSV